MSALICGSIAYDTIMVFPESFKDHILPDKIHILNVSFQVPEMRREYGGCAGNIAYNLKLLGGSGFPMATVGSDFAPYAEWMEKQGVSSKYIKVLHDAYTAQAFITTDTDDNQITAFHPGAMNQSHQQSVPADAGVTFGMVSPDGRDGMIAHANEFTEAGIPFMFDPGQGLPLFSGVELVRFVEQANWLVVNDYEMQMLERKTGMTVYELGERVAALVVTWGGKGSVIYTEGRRIDIPPAKPDAILDPTGCGDAYRAGFIYGLMSGMDWETTGHIASLMGAIKIGSQGTQNHSFTRDEFDARFEATFGYKL